MGLLKMSEFTEETQEVIIEQGLKRHRAITSIFTSIAGFISACTLSIVCFVVLYILEKIFGG